MATPDLATAPAAAFDVRERQTAPAPETQASAPEPSGGIQSLLDLERQRIKAYETLFGSPSEIKAKMETQEQQAKQAEQQAAAFQQQAVVPSLGNLLQQTRAQQPPVPDLAPPPPASSRPSQEVRPFMDVSGKNALQGALSTLTLMAQMAMAGKAPVGALNAMTGAMNGWFEGDRARSQREWENYLAQVDAIREENRNKMAMWEASQRQHTSNITAAQAEFIAMLGAGRHYDEIAHVAREGMPSAFQQMQALDKQYADLKNTTMQLITIKSNQDLRLAIEKMHADEKAATLAQNERHFQEREARMRSEFAQRQQAGEESMPSPELVDWLAQQATLGAPLMELTRGFGRFAGKVTIQIQEAQRRQALEAGDDAGAAVLARRNLTANTDSLKKVQKESAEFNTFMVTFEKNVENLKRLSDAYKSGGVPWANRSQLQFDAYLKGNTDASNLLKQYELVAQDAARVLARGRGTTTVSAQNHARELMDSGATHQQLDSAIKDVFSKDAMYAAMGFDETLKDLRKAISTGGKQVTPGSREVRARRKDDPSKTATIFLAPGEQMPGEWFEDK